MEIDFMQVEVKPVTLNGVQHLALIVEETKDDEESGFNGLSLFMTREEASALGSMLIGMSIADGVPPRKFSHEDQNKKALDYIVANPPGPVCPWCDREHQPHCTGMMG